MFHCHPLCLLFYALPSPLLSPSLVPHCPTSLPTAPHEPPSFYQARALIYIVQPRVLWQSVVAPVISLSLPATLFCPRLLRRRRRRTCSCPNRPAHGELSTMLSPSSHGLQFCAVSRPPSPFNRIAASRLTPTERCCSARTAASGTTGTAPRSTLGTFVNKTLLAVD